MPTTNHDLLSDEERAELHKKLEILKSKYDPFYMYSDDHRVYVAGEELSDKISAIKHRLARDEEARKGLGEYQDRMAGVGMGNYVVDKDSATESANYGWTHDSLSDRLFEQERTYEEYLFNLLKKKLGR